MNSKTTNYKLQTTRRLRVAIVCDWLLGTGGAERVVLELHKMFPKAPIYTSQYNPDPKIWYGDEWFKDADVRTGWLQKLPRSLKKFLPVFRAWYFSRLNLEDYDLVISSSGAEAKFVKTRPGATHITYCHAPSHYYWARYDDYRKNPGFGKLDPLARLGLKLLVGPMRRWDYKAAQRPNYFIANSNFTRAQIKKYYGRDTEVIHPPVDVERFAKATKPADERHGFVTAGRQTPYKKISLAVEAANQADVPLIVIGNGPDHRKLKRLAGRKITMLTNVSDEDMPEKLASAKAFIFPGVDDFGIVAVEAMASGTPVIAFDGGGAKDYVDSACGMFFSEPTAKCLADAINIFSSKSYGPGRVIKQAERFSATNFRASLERFLQHLPKPGPSS